MKILILGGTGMLGHQLFRHFASRHETWVTVRRDAPVKCLGDAQVIRGVDVMNLGSVESAVCSVRPDVVLNCIGIIKQLDAAKDPIASLTINSLFPHQLAALCGQQNAHLVLFSTDCVFSGARGRYVESDESDAKDLYGRTKFLGEIANRPNVTTIRSSIIGRELDSAHSLVEWFLSERKNKICGYRNAIYTGFTTIEMARIVERVIMQVKELAGLWQVASKPITKYDLLLLLRRHFKLQVEIEPVDKPICDRSLIGERFNKTAGYQAPAWDRMIEELATIHE